MMREVRIWKSKDSSLSSTHLIGTIGENTADKCSENQCHDSGEHAFTSRERNAGEVVKVDAAQVSALGPKGVEVGKEGKHDREPGRPLETRGA